MPPLLLTDWMTLGTAGPTVDGRNIEEAKLQQAAKNYDPENYCAVINLEHYYGNLGDVQELRSVKDKQDRICLQGRVRPNLTYLAYNASGSKLFFSMELTDNFADTFSAAAGQVALGGPSDRGREWLYALMDKAIADLEKAPGL